VRILIAGGSGYLGTELARQAVAAGHEVIGTYWSAPADVPGVGWRQLDVRRRDDVRALVGATSPDVVLNAAYQYDDWDTTATGAGYLAAAAEQAGAHLVHVSSDALFSGAAASYPETARPDPVMPYGAAKAAAETAVQAVHPAATIAHVPHHRRRPLAARAARP
jgi:dTDP-4-dehydrorhamnose reductase